MGVPFLSLGYKGPGSFVYVLNSLRYGNSVYKLALLLLRLGNGLPLG